MIPLCIHDLRLQIVNYLSFDDILNLRYILKDIDELVYWKSLQYKCALTSNHYLIKDAFDWTEEYDLEPLYDYLMNEPNICIAGGYPTLLFLGKDTQDFSGDIDIYIFRSTNHDMIDTLQRFTNIIQREYGIKHIDKIGPSECHSVFNIYTCLPRPIQIIGTCDTSLSEIIRQFDASHNRCAWYMGHTYVTYDALYAKERMMTYFIKNHYNHKRLNKAHQLGFEIFQYPDYQLPSYFKFVDVCYRRMPLITMLALFTPIALWYHEYTGIICDNFEAPPKEDHYLSRPLSIFDVIANLFKIDKYDYNNQHYLLRFIVQARNKYHIFLDELNWGVPEFQINGYISQNFHRYNITICDNIDIDKIKHIKNLIFNFYFRYHGKPPKSPHPHTPNLTQYYIDHLAIDDVKNIAYINKFLSNNMSIDIVDQRMLFTIQVQPRIAKKIKRHHWFNGNNGSYGHVYYKIVSAQALS